MDAWKAIKSSWDGVSLQESHMWIELQLKKSFKGARTTRKSWWNEEDAGNFLRTCDERKGNGAFGNDRETWWKQSGGKTERNAWQYDIMAIQGKSNTSGIIQHKRYTDPWYPTKCMSQYGDSDVYVLFLYLVKLIIFVLLVPAPFNDLQNSLFNYMNSYQVTT